MSRFHFADVGRPHSEQGHARMREGASLLAALAGGVAIILAGILIISSTGPGEAVALWAAVVVLLTVWISGLWWRWDSPDARDPHAERERRSF